jgi:diguanylate cyclase (GGDEF)-like protein
VDIHTLHIEHVVLLSLYTLLTLVNCRLHRGAPGGYWFPVYNLSALLGACLIALRGQIPDFFSIVLGCWFVVFAYIALYVCAAQFFRQKLINQNLLIAFCVVALALLVQWGYIHPDTSARLIVYSALLTVEQGLTAAFVFHHAKGSLRASSGLLGLMLALLCLSSFIRILGVSMHGAPRDYLQAGAFLAWILLLNSAFQCGALVAFVWMTAASLRHDLEVLASTDSLTGLLNRRAMETAAAQAIVYCGKTQSPLSAVLIDLDDFKRINDSYGHDCGDATLIAVAQCLQLGMRQNDLLARLGGDEFAILLPDTSVNVAIEIAERLRNDIEKLDIVHGQISTYINASFGLAEIQGTTNGWDQLITTCDKAMYNVKSVGGNLVIAH